MAFLWWISQREVGFWFDALERYLAVCVRLYAPGLQQLLHGQAVGGRQGPMKEVSGATRHHETVEATDDGTGRAVPLSLLTDNVQAAFTVRSIARSVGYNTRTCVSTAVLARLPRSPSLLLYDYLTGFPRCAPATAYTVRHFPCRGYNIQRS